MMEAREIELRGIVQGVGFRPFVYRLAQKFNLQGWVYNNSQGLYMHVEGEKENLISFKKELFKNPPPQALIKDYNIAKCDVLQLKEFKIITSKKGSKQEVLISPDLAICRDCRLEVLNKKDRRYKYPFTNCTNCGPRFTIIEDVPYDRAKTTMAGFTMCSLCEGEFTNPLNRRFHAQPNACPQCGPQVKLLDKKGQEIGGGLEKAVDLLEQGYILAIKGLGGYHLVCDALNNESVKRLRKSKKREYKPFAVMAKNIEVIKKYCFISKLEEQQLLSPQAPIVILNRKGGNLPDSLTPGVNTLGVMIPYTPLHLLLFQKNLQLLVMTSGNISSNPLIYKDYDAQKELEEITDYFLMHNRNIFNRCDDSIVKIINNAPQLYRRARGYVPLPIDIPIKESVLACGGDLKNTFCLTKEGQGFLSQHMGDLENYNNFQEYLTTIKRMKNYLKIEPRKIVVDLHPEYFSKKWGFEQGLPIIEVQHHHAHLASCLADNGIDEKVLGVICDGTGFGTDGNIWGMEFLLGDFKEFKRLARLEYIPLPGGEKAIREPWRIAVSYILKHYPEQGLEFYADYFKEIKKEHLEMLKKQIELKINSPLSSSCGRLFDGVSALLGICRYVDYEGQAAIELEEIVDKKYCGSGYDFTIFKKDLYIISTKIMWQQIIMDMQKGLSKKIIAAKFHITVAEMILKTIKQLKSVYTDQKIALSGGVMQNKFLCERVGELLIKNGYQPLFHKQVPANDGGLSLGQSVIGGNKKCV